MTDPAGPLPLVDEDTGAVHVFIPDERGHLDVPTGHRWRPLPTTRVRFQGGPADGLEADAEQIGGVKARMFLYVSVVHGMAVPLAGPPNAPEFTAALRDRPHDLYQSDPQWKVRAPGDDAPHLYRWDAPAGVQPDPQVY